MPAKADRIEDLYIAEKGNVSSMAEKKIGEIREELKAVDDEKLPSFIETYEKDERSGVVKIVEQAKKRIEKLEAEKLRIENLKKYEREYADCGYICGIDEVGRGPLAGPVVAGAVILPKDCDILYINDSKKLTAAKREELYDEIMEKAVAAGIGAVANTFRLELVDLTACPPAAAAFMGALAAGLLASLIKSRVGYPRISVTVPSIVIMVPGLYLYRGFYNLGMMSLSASASWFASAILIVAALPLGLIFARILTDKTFRYCT